MVYGSEYCELRKHEEQRFYITYMNMLVWSQGKTSLKMKPSDELQQLHLSNRSCQIRLLWYRHVMRKEETHITHNKKQTKYESDENKTQMTYSDETIYIDRQTAPDRERWYVIAKYVDTTG